MDISQCRVCLSFSEGCTSLFAKNKGTSLSQMIIFCTGVQIVEEDDLPSKACPKCCEHAALSYMFVNKCRKSDAELRTQQMLGLSIQPVEFDTAETHSLHSYDNLQLSEKQATTEIDEIESVHSVQELCGSDPSEENKSLHGCDDFSRDNKLEAIDYETCVLLYEDEEYLLECNVEKTVPQGNEAAEDHDSSGEFDEYYQSATTSDIYFCCYNDCTEVFSSKRKLQHHLRLQHQIEIECEPSHETAKRCSNCGRLFASTDALRMHEIQLQLKRTLLSECRKGRPKLYPCLFQATEKICCGCFEVFPTTEALLAHCESKHSIRKTVTDPTRPVQCPICYKLFRAEGHARRHRSIVYKPRNHCCSVCDASFTTASLLAHHQNQHFSEEKHVCEECGLCLKSEQNLKMHILLHREKREVCKICGLRFHRKSNLKMHQRTHADSYYHVCPHCPKKHKNRSQLNEHLKVHTKVTPYECRHCPKQFRYYSDRKRHEMAHTGDYPFECSSCSTKFVRSLSYKQHVAKCKGSVIEAGRSQPEIGN